MTFQEREWVYIIENNLRVSWVMIYNRVRDFYTVRFLEKNGAAKLRGSRLFKTKEEAEEIIKERRTLLSKGGG